MSINTADQLQKLYAKKKEYKVPLDAKPEEQATIWVKAIGLDETELFGGMSAEEAKNMSPKDMVTKFKPIIARSLDISEEEVGKFGYDVVVDLMEIIAEINGFDKLKEKRDAQKRIPSKLLNTPANQIGKSNTISETE